MVSVSGGSLHGDFDLRTQVRKRRLTRRKQIDQPRHPAADVAALLTGGLRPPTMASTCCLPPVVLTHASAFRSAWISHLTLLEPLPASGKTIGAAVVAACSSPTVASGDRPRIAQYRGRFGALPSVKAQPAHGCCSGSWWRWWSLALGFPLIAPWFCLERKIAGEEACCAGHLCCSSPRLLWAAGTQIRHACPCPA